MNNKSFTTEQILALKQALETAGVATEKGVDISDPETFAVKFSGGVRYSGKRFSGEVVVSFRPVSIPCYTSPKEPARGGIIVAVKPCSGPWFHTAFNTFRALDTGKVVDLFGQVNDELDHNAKWDEMWNAWVKGRRENNYSDSYKTRFLHKYADEHFPGEFFKLRKNNKRK